LIFILLLKQTKEKEVRKAITRMDQETKNTGKSTMKKKKVDAKVIKIIFR